MPVEVSFSSAFTARSARTIYGPTPYEGGGERFALDETMVLFLEDGGSMNTLGRDASSPHRSHLGLGHGSGVEMRGVRTQSKL